jgi:hypothetical protein
VKWLFSILLSIILVGGLIYIYLHRQELGLGGSRPATVEETATSFAAPAGSAGKTGQAGSAAIVWEKIDRSGDGFTVEMPTGVQQTRVPAYNEQGGEEPVEMILSNPSADTTFSVAWADNPPVARVNQRSAERTLEMARDDALNRTQTALVNESGTTFDGFPARDFAAQNANGGTMNSRLIYAGKRLFMLTAVFPSAAARRDTDVTRFFNSFAINKDEGPGNRD